jgi:hypothetical protein
MSDTGVTILIAVVGVVAGWYLAELFKYLRRKRAQR